MYLSCFQINMACGLALKRPHDYDSYLVEEGFATDAKRARHSTHCSPFRPQMGTIAASLPSTSNFAQSVAKVGVIVRYLFFYF